MVSSPTSDTLTSREAPLPALSSLSLPPELQTFAQHVYAQLDTLRKRVTSVESRLSTTGAGAGVGGTKRKREGADSSETQRGTSPPLQRYNGNGHEDEGISSGTEGAVETEDAGKLSKRCKELKPATTLEFLALGMDRRLGAEVKHQREGEGPSREPSPQRENRVGHSTLTFSFERHR